MKEIRMKHPQVISDEDMFLLNLEKSKWYLGDWLVNQRGEVFQIMELPFHFRDEYLIKGLSKSFICQYGDTYTLFEDVLKKKGRVVNLKETEDLFDFCKEQVSKLSKWDSKIKTKRKKVYSPLESYLRVTLSDIQINRVEEVENEPIIVHTNASDEVFRVTKKRIEEEIARKL